MEGVSVMWTCIECEHGYDSNTGSTDERMCIECLDAQYEIWMEEKKRNHKMIEDIQYSNCCGEVFAFPGYPDNDICSNCNEHAELLEEE